MGKYNFIPRLAAKRTTKKEENNFIMIILGSTGSGKSYSGIATGLMTKIYATVKYKNEHKEQPRFDSETIVFKANEIMDLLDEGLPPQSIIQLDEGGEIADARKWWSDPNDVLTSTIDTFRADRLSLIWCTPDLDRIDKRIREEADIVAQMVEKRKMKVQSVTKDRVSNKLLNPYPKLKNAVLKGNTQDGDYANVHVCDLYNLVKEIGEENLIDKYEKRKRAFINEIQSKGKKRLNGEDVVPKLEMMDIVKLIVNKWDDVNVAETSKTTLLSIFRGRLNTEHPDYEVTRRDLEDAVNFYKSDMEYAKEVVKNNS